MAVSKKILADYLLKFPSNDEGHHLVGSSLMVIMDKFTTLGSPYCRNFVSNLKRFVCKRMDTVDRIMVLKDHSGFNYVYGSRFLG